MNARMLRHRVTLQTQVDTVDGLGQPSTSWLTTATLWADIRYLSGLSTIKSGADVSIVKVSIRIRQRSINPGQRFAYGNEVFDIEAVLPDGTRQWIDLVCTVKNADV